MAANTPGRPTPSARGRSRPLRLFSDPLVGSYPIVGDLLAATLGDMGLRIEQRDFDDLAREARRANDNVVLQNTIGPHFLPLPGRCNVAIVHHEWDRYPEPWVQRLNAFTEAWVTTTFVRQTLVRSGVRVPVRLVRPALDHDVPPLKSDYTISSPLRVLARGSAHFRKGFHFLIAGFLRAFPSVGQAELVIHTDHAAGWVSPRSDVRFDTGRPSRDRLLATYRDFDLFVSTSLGEGLGLPVAEAILAGVPVATASWGGHRDLLRDGCYYRVGHAVVPQPYCSRPDYYAAGQQCAVISIDALALVLRRAAAAPASARMSLATRARAALLGRYGQRAVRQRLHRTAGVMTDLLADASGRPA